MADLAKAVLIELDERLEKEKPGGKREPVQFNPESLKVTFANQVVQPEGGDQSAGSAGMQFVGAGTTKLALTLWYDVTAMEKDPVDDVRRETSKVLYFMTPQAEPSDPKKLRPPGIRFHWGTFLFDGIVEGVEETLELFSVEGKPLRASLNLTIAQQKIWVAKFDPMDPLLRQPGRTPMNAAKQGDSLQNMAGQNGKSDWQGIAAANGIEDPLRMAPGALVDLNASLSVGGSSGASFGASAAFGVGASFGASGGVSVGGAVSLSAAPGLSTTGALGAGASVNAGLGGAASASLSIG